MIVVETRFSMLCTGCLELTASYIHTYFTADNTSLVISYDLLPCKQSQRSCFDVIGWAGIGERSIVMSVSVCLSVCACVFVSPRSCDYDFCQWSVATTFVLFYCQVRYLDIYLFYVYGGWVGSRVASVLEGPGFKSQPRRCRVTVLGKLFTPIVLLFTKQQNW